MRYAALISLTLCAALAACSSLPQSARVNWAGTYGVTSSMRVPNEKSLSGFSTKTTGSTLLEETSNIPAQLGGHFGFGYSLRGGIPDEIVTLRAVVRYPDGGLTNPETGKTALLSEWPQSCRVGGNCAIGYTFDWPWELRPGTWKLELWQGGRLFAIRSFEVYLP